ncbi:hypothetical protein G5I_07688 [Acromyrmex echinatior]|uniref:Uncharacterized protein n=1 Tax=Acromyrmex echinatior TaxID=103372 RepID=F4WPH3_ACREC|nr:hypothetical protein G5I_07688 [Acromyrmex echinatior]
MRVSLCDKLRKHHARLRQARRGLGCSSAANVHGYDATLAPMGTSREEQVLLSRIVCTRVRAHIAYNIASSIEPGLPCVWVADTVLSKGLALEIGENVKEIENDQCKSGKKSGNFGKIFWKDPWLCGSVRHKHQIDSKYILNPRTWSLNLQLSLDAFHLVAQVNTSIVLLFVTHEMQRKVCVGHVAAANKTLPLPFDQSKRVLVAVDTVDKFRSLCDCQVRHSQQKRSILSFAILIRKKREREDKGCHLTWKTGKSQGKILAFLQSLSLNRHYYPTTLIHVGR